MSSAEEPLSDDPVEILRDHDPLAREMAADFLASKGGGLDADDALQNALSDPEPLVRAAAATALGQRGDASALRRLYKALRDMDPRVRAATIDAVGQLGDETSVPRLKRLLRDPDEDVRNAVRPTMDTLQGRRRPFEIHEWVGLPSRRLVERTDIEVVNPILKSMWAHVRGTGPTYADVEFRGCSIQCHFGNRTKEPRFRPVVRNVRLLSCTLFGTMIGPVVMEDVLVENCNTSKFVFLYGAAFKHVVLRGRIGSISLKPAWDRDQRSVWQAANRAYYSAVDWALDLREAEVGELDLHGVPANLIRRDPASQVVITRARAASGRWQEILERSDWTVAIKWFLEDPAEQDLVLVAPKRHRRYREYLEVIRRLREAGVAEPD